MARIGGPEAIVAAICADYDRRESCVQTGSVSTRTRMEYIYLNAKVFDAACEQVGMASAALYIREIGAGVGYAHSAVENISEGTYKANKSELVRGIARKLHLMD